MTDIYEVPYHYYSTELYDTEAEAWQDLMDYIKPLIDDHWVWFRVPPEVNSNFEYNTKKTVYQGFVRFIINPKALGLDKDNITIPTIGEA